MNYQQIVHWDYLAADFDRAEVKMHMKLQYCAWSILEFRGHDANTVIASVPFMSPQARANLCQITCQLLEKVHPMRIVIVRTGPTSAKVCVNVADHDAMKMLHVRNISIQISFQSHNAGFLRRQWEFHVSDDGIPQDLVLMRRKNPKQSILAVLDSASFLAGIRVDLNQTLAHKDSEILFPKNMAPAHGDVCIITRDKKAYLCCRKLLSDHSPSFAYMIGHGTNAKPFHLFLPQLMGHDLEAMLRFLYHGEMSCNLVAAVNLLKLSVFYNIALLTYRTQELLLRALDCQFDVPLLIQIIQLPRAPAFDAIRRKAIRILREKPKEQLRYNVQLRNVFLWRPDLSYELFLGIPL